MLPFAPEARVARLAKELEAAWSAWETRERPCSGFVACRREKGREMWAREF